MVTTGMGLLISGLAGLGGSVGSAKAQSSAAQRQAKLQADASRYAADLQDAAGKRALGFTQKQSFLDQVRANAAAKAQYGADVASSRNLYNLAGDQSYNQRAEYLSGGRTEDKMWGAGMAQKNYLRDLLGYGQPQGPMSVFVEPDALRQSELEIPDEMDYGPPPVDESIDPATGKPRYV